MVYKYKVFLRKCDKDDKPAVLKKPFSFQVPLSEDEKITLTERHTNLQGMPEWAKNQNSWVISHIFHIPDCESYLILTSAESILNELIFNSVLPEATLH